MRVKYFVGKDRAAEKAKVKEKRVYQTGPVVCRNCGDEYNAAGFCAKCTATLELYRDVDNQRFAEFQRRVASRMPWHGRA